MVEITVVVGVYNVNPNDALTLCSFPVGHGTEMNEYDNIIFKSIKFVTTEIITIAILNNTVGKVLE